MAMTDQITKLLADPDGLRRLYEEIRRQQAEREAEQAAAIEAERQQTLQRMITAEVAKFAAALDQVRADVEAIRKRDGERRYLASLNAAQHNNGQLTFDAEKFRQAWECWGTA
jgi:hypothetical protein